MILVRKAFAVFLGGAIGLLMAEGLLWLLGMPYFYRAHSSSPQFEILQDLETGRVFYVNKPMDSLRFEYDGNPRGYFDEANGVEHPTNSSGFRGPEFAPFKPDNTLRLLFLGDSFTFGEGVRFEDTFVERTRSSLAEKWGDQQIRVECRNLGVGGYNTADELFLLEKMAPQSRPDAVVLCYVLNDAEPPLFQLDAQGRLVRRAREDQLEEGVATPSPPAGWLYRSRLVQLLWRFLAERQASRQTEHYYRQLYRPDSPDWQGTQRALQEVGAYCQAHDIPLYVVLFPILHRLDAEHPFRDIYDDVLDRAKAQGAHTINLLPAFTGQSAGKLWVHPTDQHPNELAHAIAADVLAKYLAGDKHLLEKVQALRGHQPNKP